MRADTHQKTGQKASLLQHHRRRYAVEWSSVCLPLTAARNCKMSLMACAHAQRSLIAFSSPARWCSICLLMPLHCPPQFPLWRNNSTLPLFRTKCACFSIQVWHGLSQSANGITYSRHPNWCSYICLLISVNVFVCVSYHSLVVHIIIISVTKQAATRTVIANVIIIIILVTIFSNVAAKLHATFIITNVFRF